MPTSGFCGQLLFQQKEHMVTGTERVDARLLNLMMNQSKGSLRENLPVVAEQSVAGNLGY